MNRLLYEKSSPYKGYLIVPFVFNKVENHNVYSYKLLSGIGNKSRFQKTENPAAIYGNSVENVVTFAKEHLDKNLEAITQIDYFKSRYVSKSA